MSLIDTGVNVNVFDLVRYLRYTSLEYFLCYHCSVITQYGHGESALIVAAREGRTEVVSLLLEAGANTDLQDIKVKFQLTTRCGFIIPSYHCPSSHSMGLDTLH